MEKSLFVETKRALNILVGEVILYTDADGNNQTMVNGQFKRVFLFQFSFNSFGMKRFNGR